MSKAKSSQKRSGKAITSSGKSVNSSSGSPVKKKSDGKLSRLVDSSKKMYQSLRDYAIPETTKLAEMAARGRAMKEYWEGASALADAHGKLSEQFGPEKAKQIIEAAPEIFMLRQQAGERLLHTEMRRQQNIDSVTSKAKPKLPRNVPEDPVHPDWTARFIESVKDVSDETMQNLWASVLAGEVKEPGKTSLRTLDVIKNLSQKEAQVFEKILPFAMSGWGIYYPHFVSGADEIIEKILPYSIKIKLTEWGLINPDNQASSRHVDVKHVGFTLGIHAFSAYPTTKQGTFSVSIPTLSITEVGQEIARMTLARPAEIWYIREIARFFSAHGATLCVEGKYPKNTSVLCEANWVLKCQTPISPEASDKKIQSILDRCPVCVLIESP